MIYYNCKNSCLKKNNVYKRHKCLFLVCTHAYLWYRSGGCANYRSLCQLLTKLLTDRWGVTARNFYLRHVLEPLTWPHSKLSAVDPDAKWVGIFAGDAPHVSRTPPLGLRASPASHSRSSTGAPRSAWVAAIILLELKLWETVSVFSQRAASARPLPMISRVRCDQNESETG